MVGSWRSGAEHRQARPGAPTASGALPTAPGGPAASPASVTRSSSDARGAAVIPPTTMRSHYCGDLRPAHIGAGGGPVRLGGPPPRARRAPGLRRPAGPFGRWSRWSSTGPTTCAASTWCGWWARCGPGPRARSTRRWPRGEVEVGDCRVEVLSVAEPPPIPITEHIDVDETQRLRYRYLDLRRERLQRNLRLRARVTSAIRAAMEAQGFVDIETPLLIASTPEGARDFVVPSRLKPGNFYALPQSPQLFKQLSMVGGMDRYYQLARCLRDEDLRADRQFEFTQLDLEASFVTQAEVRAFTGEAVAAAAEAATGQRPSFHPDMTWHEAQERYGSDKPDIRFGLELVELTPLFAGTGFNAFRAPCVKGICVPGGGGRSRSQLDELVAEAKRFGAKGLVWMRVEEGGTVASPVAKFLEPTEVEGLLAALRGRPGRPGADRGRRAAPGASRAGPAAPPPGPAAGQRGRAALPVGRRLPALRGDRRRDRRAGAGPPPLHDAPRRRPGLPRRAGRPAALGRGPARRPEPGLRPGAQRLGAGLGLGPDPSRRGPAAHLRAVGHRRRHPAAPLRLPARRLSLWRSPACGVRVRHRPPGRPPGRRGEHPRGHRLPQDPVRHRPPHQRPHRARPPPTAGARPPDRRSSAPRPS